MSRSGGCTFHALRAGVPSRKSQSPRGRRLNNPTADLQTTFVRHLVAEAHPLLSEWIGRGRLEAEITQDVKTQIDRIHDREFAGLFSRAEGIPVSAYNHRLLEISEGQRVIAGIRFKGGNRALPFIYVLSDFPAQSGRLNFFQ